MSIDAEEFGTRGLSSTVAYLEADHERLDRALAEARHCIAHHAPLGARDSFGEFDRRLRRHIRLEESSILPRFRSGIRAMKREHRQMEKLLDLGIEALARDDGAAFARAAHSLEKLCRAHDRKEERLYRRM